MVMFSLRDVPTVSGMSCGRRQYTDTVSHRASFKIQRFEALSSEFPGSAPRADIRRRRCPFLALALDHHHPFNPVIQCIKDSLIIGPLLYTTHLPSFWPPSPSTLPSPPYEKIAPVLAAWRAQTTIKTRSNSFPGCTIGHHCHGTSNHVVCCGTRVLKLLQSDHD